MTGAQQTPVPPSVADAARGDAARHGEMLANRLRKRVRHLRRWARRAQVSCYRVYDRDIPEIPLVIDWYDGRLHIAQYERKRSPEPGWMATVAAAAGTALEVPHERIYVKQRRRQRGLSQYERIAGTKQRFVITEAGHRFLVNLSDYLDTGLFLDHRITRARVAEAAAGTRFLNLFCYTGSFTVYAAAGGARETVSVDLSRTYLDWARDNMELNGYGGSAHTLVRADVNAFLQRSQPEFDLAVLDPPAFSNSKKTAGVLDLQRDHVELINRTLALLRPGGALYFATGYRRLKLTTSAIQAREITAISHQTVPEDFRDQRVHRCWLLTR